MTRRPQCFTIEVDGKPTIGFEAKSWNEAQELGREEGLRADLQVMTSAGISLCGKSSKLRARLGTPAEMETYRQQHSAASNLDDLALVYLVPIDWSTGPSA